MVDIKLNANMAGFMNQLEALRKKLAELKEEDSSIQGSAKLNEFGAAAKQLDDVVSTAEKLVDTMGQVDTKSKSYAKYLRETVAILKEAEKVAIKIADKYDVIRKAQGKNAPATSVLSDLIRKAEISAQKITAYKFAQLEHEKEIIKQQKESLKQQKEAEAVHAGWAKTAGKIASVAAGSLLGGGGMFANVGALAGLIPGIGPIAGPIGGAIGGMADSAIGPDREEFLRYSELRKSLGGVTSSFDDLMGTTRKLTEGLLLSNVEAANFAKQFAKTASLTEDKNNDIAESVKNAAGLAKGYGIDTGLAVGFMGTSRLTGNTKDAQSDNKFIVKLAETLAKSGSTAKSDEMMSLIAGYMKTQTEITLAKPNTNQYMDLISNLMASGLPGLKGNPSNAAGLIQKADEAVRGSDVAADQFWQGALANVMPEGSRYLQHFSFMKEQGDLGDLQKAFGPESSRYKASTPDTQKEMDVIAKAFKDHNIKTMEDLSHLAVEMYGNTDYSKEYIMKVLQGQNRSTGLVYYNATKRGANGSTPIDDLIKSTGYKGDIPTEKLNSLANIAMAGPEELESIYKNLKDSDKTAWKGEKPDFKENSVKFGEEYGLEASLAKAILNHQMTDPGEAAKEEQMRLQNETNALFSKLVPTLTNLDEHLVQLMSYLPETDRDKKLRSEANAAQKVLDNPEATPEQKSAAQKTKDDLSKLDVVPGEESTLNKTYDAAGNVLHMGKEFVWPSEENQTGVAEDINKWMHTPLWGNQPKEYNGFGIDNEDWDSKPGKSVMDSIIKPAEGSIGNYNPDSNVNLPAYMDSEAEKKRTAYRIKKLNAPSKYDDIIKSAAAANNIDPMILKSLLIEESGLDPSATSNKGAIGLGQLLPETARMLGIPEGEERDPEQNINGAAKWLAMKRDTLGHGNIWEGVKRYVGIGSAADLARDRVKSTYYGQNNAYGSRDRDSTDYLNGETLSDGVPTDIRPSQSSSKDQVFTHKLEVTLRDSSNKVIPAAYTSSTIQSPRPNGHM